MSEIKPDPGVEGRYCIVGELSLETVPELFERGTRIMAQGVKTVELDLREVTRADSAGLALMIEWMRTAHRQHKNIVFRNVPPQMVAMAKISGLEDILPLER